MDLSFEIETLDECSQSYGIWLTTLLENVGKYRKGKRDLTQLTKEIDQYAQSD
jgi:hypothetical protein